MKVILACIVLFICAVGTFGQQQQQFIEAPKPKLIEAPKPVKVQHVADKKFWVVMGILGASKAADGFTSLGAPSSCREENPILGPHPSAGRYAGYFAVTYGIEVGTAFLLKRYSQHHKWARGLWLIEPARQTTLHIRWSAHNAGLRECR